MVNGLDRPAGPVAQFRSKGLTGRNCTVGPEDRPFRQKSSEASIQPYAIFAAGNQVAIKIGGSVQRIARKQNLRNRRISQREVSGREQNVRSALANQSLQLGLLEPEASRRGSFQFQKLNVACTAKFLPQTWAENNR